MRFQSGRKTARAVKRTAAPSRTRRSGSIATEEVLDRVIDVPVEISGDPTSILSMAPVSCPDREHLHDERREDVPALDRLGEPPCPRRRRRASGRPPLPRSCCRPPPRATASAWRIGMPAATRDASTRAKRDMIVFCRSGRRAAPRGSTGRASAGRARSDRRRRRRAPRSRARRSGTRSGRRSRSRRSGSASAAGARRRGSGTARRTAGART